MAMTLHNLEVDSYLEARGLLYEKFTQACIELGIMIDDPKKGLIVSESVELDYEDSFTQTKLNQLLALSTSLENSLKSYQDADLSIKTRKTEIEKELNTHLVKLLEDPRLEKKLSEDEKIKELEIKLEELRMLSASKDNKLKYQLKQQQMVDINNNINDRKKELVREAIFKHPDLSPEANKLQQELNDVRQWSSAEQRKKLLLNYGDMSFSNSNILKVNSKYLNDYQKFLEPEGQQKRQALDQNAEPFDKLIRDKYFKYLQQSDSGKKIDVDNINIGEFRKAYLSSQKKQAQLKAMFPDYIAKHISDKHYIKAKSKKILSNTEDEIKLFLAFLDDDTQLKDPKTISTHLENLGIKLTTPQIEEITLSLSLNHVQKIGEEISNIASEPSVSTGCLMSLVQAFWNFIALLSVIFTCCLNSPNEDDHQYSAVASLSI